MLTNMLEKYTRVLFVGEPTGARPVHYGDARKTRLKNSGLTLRVSSLHWSSQHGNDEREANNPDLPAPWTSQAFFAGRDPALEMVFTSGPHSFKSLTRAAIQRDDHYQIARYMTHAILSPDTHGDDLSKIYLALGKEFVEEGALDFASFAFRYGLYLYPDDADLKAEFAKMKD